MLVLEAHECLTKKVTQHKIVCLMALICEIGTELQVSFTCQIHVDQIHLRELIGLWLLVLFLLLIVLLLCISAFGQIIHAFS
jgi:hypothetical protein